MANSSVAWAFRAPRLAGITSASGLGRHAHTSSACRVPAFLSCIAWVVVRREPPRGVFPAPRQAADNTAEADTLYFWSESTHTHTHKHTYTTAVCARFFIFNPALPARLRLSLKELEVSCEWITMTKVPRAAMYGFIRRCCLYDAPCVEISAYPQKMA